MKILPNIRSNYSLDFRGVNGSGDSPDRGKASYR